MAALIRASSHRLIDRSVEVREVANTGSGVSIMRQRHVDQQAKVTVTVVEVRKIDYEFVVCCGYAMRIDVAALNDNQAFE